MPETTARHPRDATTACGCDHGGRCTAYPLPGVDVSMQVERWQAMQRRVRSDPRRHRVEYRQAA